MSWPAQKWSPAPASKINATCSVLTAPARAARVRPARPPWCLWSSRLLPEQSLEHLAGRVARQAGPELQLMGHLVIGQPPPAEGQHIGHVQGIVRVGDQVGLADLAEPGVGDPDDG